MSVYMRQLGAVVWKDVRVELRTRQRIATTTAFAVLVPILFHYALDRTLVRPRDVGAGLIWMTIVFGGLLALGRTFELEEEESAMQGLLLSPIPLDALYLAKVTANFLLLVGLEAVTFAAFGLFFGIGFGDDPLALGAVVLLATLGFVAVGTLLSAISNRTTLGDTLLPVLVFPLLVPVIVFGVTATARLFAGRPLAEVTGNMRLLGAYALLALLTGAVLFRYVVEE